MSDADDVAYGAPTDRARHVIARRRKWRWPLHLGLGSLLLLTVCGGMLWVAYQGAEARAVQVVTQLGGRVRWQDDRAKQGRVVSVFLGVAGLQDDDLARLTPWWWTFPELRDLDLSDSAISDAGLAHLRGATLRSLMLDNTRITNDGLRNLAGNAELRSLSLNGTQVDDDGLDYLSGLTRLGNLYLRGTPISDEGLRRLENVVSLRYLQLGQNRGVSDEGIQRLQRALPELRISR